MCIGFELTCVDAYAWIGVEGKPAAEGGMLFSPKK